MNIRYRTELTFGSGHRDIIDVIWYETFQLGNSDILDYFLTHYSLDKKLTAKCRDYANELMNNGYVADISEQEQRNFCQSLITALNRETHKDIKYALWLADKDSVMHCYNYGNQLTEDDIDAYETSSVILSDLGIDGTLYGYENCPFPITF